MDDPTSSPELALRAIYELRAVLNSVEARARKLKGKDVSPADIKMAETVMALNAVVKFCAAYRMNVRPFGLLLGDLGSLALGRKSSLMLAYRGDGGRPQSHVFEEYVKGAVSAVVDYLRTSGETTRAAARHVTSALPQSIREFLRSPNRPDTPTAKTIEGWVALYESPESSFPHGRLGFEEMMKRLLAERPPKTDLKQFMEVELSAFVLLAEDQVERGADRAAGAD